ncbi:MAG: PEGA domain-containing protein [Myxococcota bacterium]
MNGIVSLVFATTLGATSGAAHSSTDVSTRADDRIVLLGRLTALGSTSESAAATERVLVAELEGLLGSRLRRTDDLRSISDDVRSAVDDCKDESSCLLEIAAAVGWDSLLLGNVAGLGDQRVITLRHLDARSGKEIGRQSVQASGEERELIVQIRGAVVKLLAPERYVGMVRFEVSQPGVQIMVDGELVGSAPLSNPVVPLSVGRHAIEANGSGLVPFSEMIDVRYGEERTITISLPANTVFVGGETPYYARWWTWAIAGAGATGLGLGGYFNVLHQDTVDEIENRAAARTLTGDDAFLFDDRDDQQRRAIVFYSIGGALSLTAAALLSLDLF